MKYKISDSVLPSVEIDVDGKDILYCEAGAMTYMSENMAMNSTMKGGILSSISRKLSGESLFMTEFSTKDGKTGHIAYSSSMPGRILPFNLKAGETLICQKDSFLAAEKSVTLESFFQKKIGRGLFGGEGFILQKLTGPGTVFVEIDGDIMERTLKQGETLQVGTGHVAIIESSVEFDVKMVEGVKNMIFGGEGLFLATLKGPGKVWIQTMPIRKLAGRIIPFLPLSKSD
ncbi:Mitochondrial biogenesis AIM24 [uncultured archaeon]|nr:Mitochondrial biogenesis AIM24 [uncultured archaeon]